MAAGRLYEFGEFRLDPTERLLFCSNKHVPLPPKAVDVLVLLVERRGHLVDKDTLLKELWPDTFVEEGSLTQNISVLRKILTEGRDGKELIETIPKRGYRFIANVREVAPEVAPRASPEESPPVPAPLARTRRRHLLWAAPLGLAVVSVAAYFAWHHYFPRSTLASRRIMLAVLPVQNLSGDPQREFISDGLTEEMIAQLGSLNPQRLGVIARTSSMAYKKTDKTVDKIGRELGVDYVLESSVRESDNRLRVTTQLIRINDQTHLWAHDYNLPLRDIVSVQDDVGRAVAAQIKLELSPEGKERLLRSRLQTPEVYELYLKGRFYWNTRSKEGLEKGLEFFQKAVEQDPQNARAYAGIADSMNLLHFYGFSPGSGTILNAKAAAERAIQLDDSLAEGHAALAYVNFMWLWDWPTAEREFRRAISLDENYLPAHHWYALYLATMGRQREAVDEIRLAQTLDPLSLIIQTAAGYIYFFGRDYERAARECKSVLDLDRNFMAAHAVIGLAYEGKGMYDEAITEFQKAFELSGGKALGYLGYLGHAYASSGRRAEAEKVLEELDELGKQRGYFPLSSKAIIYAGLGDKEKSIQFLQAAGDQNDPGMIWLRVDPNFDGLRSDPRFQEILRAQGHR